MTERKRHFARLLTTAAFAAALLAGAANAQQPAAPQTGGGQGGAGMDHGAMGHGAGGQGGGMGGMMGGGGMGQGGGMMGGMMGGGKGGGMMKHMMCRMTDHVDGRLAYLKAELKLTDAQTGLWNSFAEAYKAVAAKTAKDCAAMEQAMSQSMDKPDAAHAAHHSLLGQLDMMEKHMSAHLESVRGIKGAVTPFLAGLTEEQKKTAEKAMTEEMGLGMMGGKGGGMMGGMGGMMGGKGGGMQH